MTTVRRPASRSAATGPKALLLTILAVLFVGIVFSVLPAEPDDAVANDRNMFMKEAGKLRMTVKKKQQQFREAFAKKYPVGSGGDEEASIKPPMELNEICLLYTSPSPRDQRGSRMPSSA